MPATTHRPHLPFGSWETRAAAKEFLKNSDLKGKVVKSTRVVKSENNRYVRINGFSILFE